MVIPLGLGCAISERPASYPQVSVHEGVTYVHFTGGTVEQDLADAAQRAREEELQRMLYVTFTRESSF